MTGIHGGERKRGRERRGDGESCLHMNITSVFHDEKQANKSNTTAGTSTLV